MAEGAFGVAALLLHGFAHEEWPSPLAIPGCCPCATGCTVQRYKLSEADSGQFPAAWAHRKAGAGVAPNPHCLVIHRHVGILFHWEWKPLWLLPLCQFKWGFIVWNRSRVKFKFHEALAYLLEMLYCKPPTNWPHINAGKHEKYIHCVPSQNAQFLSSLEVYHWGWIWGQPGATAATYRAGKEVLKRTGNKPCWSLTVTDMVVMPTHSVAFYAVFLGNMVSALFREIHTEKYKKLLSFFFFLFVHVLGEDVKYHSYPQPTLLKMLQESSPEPNLKSSLGPLSAEKEAFVWSDFIYICSHFFFYCPSKRKKSETISVPKRKVVYQANHIAKNLMTLFFCYYSKFNSSEVKFY